MKKFISGVIVGALFMVSAQAFGNSINFVGKKIESETVVKVNGEEAGRAIIVDSKSFVPVRDISNKIGAEISYEKGGGIALTTKTPNTGLSESVDSVALNEAIKKQKEEIADTKNKITATSEKVKHYSELLSSTSSELSRQGYQNNYDAFKKSLDELQEDLKSQETKLASLEAQLVAPQK